MAFLGDTEAKATEAVAAATAAGGERSRKERGGQVCQSRLPDQHFESERNLHRGIFIEGPIF